MTKTAVAPATFVSAVGVFATTSITPVMAKALDSVDDDGRLLRCSTVTFRKLKALGLAEWHACAIRITHAGWNAYATLPTPPAHKIGYTHGTAGNYDGDGVFRPFGGPMIFSAWCSCGDFRYDGDEAGRRFAIRGHKARV